MDKNLKTAIVLGGTGAVGRNLIEALANLPTFGSVLAVTRKTEAWRFEKVKNIVVAEDFNNLEDTIDTFMRNNPIAGKLIGFSTLGIGAGTGFMSIEQHRSIDVELNQAFAMILKKTNQVEHFVFMSAVGADPNSWDWGFGGAGFPRYNRVKGESEDALRQVNFQSLSIFRPGMIIGIPNTPWIVEKTIPLFSFVTPSNFLSIKVQDLAMAMALRGEEEVLEKEKIFFFPDMMKFLKAS